MRYLPILHTIYIFTYLDSELEDWWQTNVIYQVYSRSFKDSDSDGMRELKGNDKSLICLQQSTVAVRSKCSVPPNVDRE